LPRPSTDELLITGAQFALEYLAGIRADLTAHNELGSMRPASDDAVEEILSPERPLVRGVRRVTKLVLFPVRFAHNELRSMRPARDDAVEEILSPERLLARGVRRVTKLVLFPVRFVYTADTGEVGTNDAAVAHYLRDEQAPSKPLVAAALEWRTAPSAEEAAAELLCKHMVPLYVHFIDDHIGRLSSLGETELVAAFGAWRHRLVG
jgi:hypothetical protein